MPYTIQNICDIARSPLNDAGKDRYPDVDTTSNGQLNTGLLTYVQSALQQLRLKRPDLFVGQFLALPTIANLADTFPLPDEYVQIVANYVTFMAESRDDEFSNSERATMMLNLLQMELS
ncbi:MAG: hypothetical protein ACYC9K_00910 [Sulfuricaulis sp.]